MYRQELEKLAYRDSITDLPNRHAMTRFFDSYQTEHSAGVLFLDLDHFKAVNDTLGHHIGDLLVREVGIRLSTFIDGPRQHVFRIGGDEFLVVRQSGDEEGAEQLARDILQHMKKPFVIEQNELYVTCSIGVSVGPVGDQDRLMLLKAADTAMYRAKALGKNQYCFFNEQIGKEQFRRLELEKDLRRAFEQKQFFLVYQPKWNVQTNSLSGFESFIRWDHSSLGIVHPQEFIPIAEENGLIMPLTEWTLATACAQCKQWMDKGIHQPVAVNVSLSLFRNDSLLETIKAVLKHTGLPPDRLELEITESVVLHDVNDIMKQLKEIRELGIRIAMDDFGSGYSALGLLDRIPIDSLKLDRLFTSDMDKPVKQTMIQAIVLMAESLNVEVVAEGIEDPQHMSMLRELGCHVMQGYYYSKPMQASAVEEWLNNAMRPADKA
ncbi:putative bifunctional diguanylate cyclase/phosphodiesterase [Paenibacillus paeoniae]|uniref:EAL domain-containing protein n=1 Tax=Paenibacillus paeoniae TaxID=2292705 RepID=A0A371P6M4_9BACL|nr:EAL domain-containing protein [Paenibacillus paeoniae]REK71178.1 EAL domain-containing protein [Paenibacillus paeoniae]